MEITFSELCEKLVVNSKDGISLGNPCDMLIDTETGKVIGFIAEGKRGIFDFFGRGNETFIFSEEIENIGKDVIIVRTEHKNKENFEKTNIFIKLFNFFL